jgi:hypothetical protein
MSDINAEATAKLAKHYGTEACTTDAGKAVLCEKPVDLSLA